MVERVGIQQEPDRDLAELGFEQKVLQGEVIFSTQLTLEDLLPERHPETNGLLNNVPVNFQVWNLGDSLLHAASFSKNYSIGKHEFYRLLNTAKPGGAIRNLSQSILGITADWKIILPEVRQIDYEARRLYDYHTKYVPGFPEFERNHFRKFWDNISTLEEQNNTLLGNQLRRFISKEALLSKYGLEFYETKGLSSISVWNNYRRAFAEFLSFRNIGGKLDPDISNTDFRKQAESTLSRLSENEQKSLLGDFYKKLSSVRGGIELALAGADRLWGSRHTIMIDEDGRMQDGIGVIGEDHQPFLFGSDSIKGIGNGQIEVRAGKSYLRVGLELNKSTGYQEPVIIERDIAWSIAPIIIWQKDKEGKGSFFCGKIPESWIKAFPHLFSRAHDTLAGQLLVSAYSPKSRDEMPREVEITDENGRKKPQNMLEAQSVLLVPMHQELFLQYSPVIAGFEALAA